MNKKTLLIRGGFLYTATDQPITISNAWIYIEADRIIRIGQVGEPEPTCPNVIDASGKMILPGFVNPHWHESFVAPNDEQPDDSHLCSTHYANGGNIEGLSALFGFISNVAKKLSDEEALAIARWSLWTQLRSGTTAIGDMGSANTADAMAQAAIDLGMRIRVSRWCSDIMIPNQSNQYIQVADTQEQIDDLERLMATWHDHHSGLVSAMPSVTGTFGSSDQQLEAIKEISDRYQAPYAAHLGALKNEAEAIQRVFGCRSIERFDRHGLLSSRLLAVHTAYANAEEYARIIETGVNICHSPAHYGMLGEATLSETKQITHFLQGGVAVSCSTDGDIYYSGGMAEAMRATHLYHNECANDNTTCPPTTALKTGTIYAAKALAWDHNIGSIEVGKQADLLLIDIDDWRYRVGNHPLRTFLVAGGSRDIDTVIVAGEILVREGRSTRFDEKDLFKDYQNAVSTARTRIAPPQPS